MSTRFNAPTLNRIKSFFYFLVIAVCLHPFSSINAQKIPPPSQIQSVGLSISIPSTFKQNELIHYTTDGTVENKENIIEDKIDINMGTTELFTFNKNKLTAQWISPDYNEYFDELITLEAEYASDMKSVKNMHVRRIRIGHEPMDPKKNHSRLEQDLTFSNLVMLGNFFINLTVSHVDGKSKTGNIYSKHYEHSTRFHSYSDINTEFASVNSKQPMYVSLTLNYNKNLKPSDYSSILVTGNWTANPLLIAELSGKPGLKVYDQSKKVKEAIDTEKFLQENGLISEGTSTNTSGKTPSKYDVEIDLTRTSELKYDLSVLVKIKTGAGKQAEFTYPIDFTNHLETNDDYRSSLIDVKFKLTILKILNEIDKLVR
ncbi:MAG: hypothetical protein IPM56_05190 [Ignavibacteriales bacterium]|nr:MAG: hypothetical protein IPM56_05190 [Ignavibacteriales bacterium]